MLSLLLATALAADPSPPPVVVEVPAAKEWPSVKVPVRTKVRLSPVDNKPSEWFLVDDKNAVLLPAGGSASFWAAEAGTYKVLMYSADKGFSPLVVMAEGVGPPPKPEPDPRPPGPPVPPPTPADPIVAKIRQAYERSAEPDRDDTRKDLVALFTQAQRFARAADLVTTGELIEKVGATADSFLPKGKLLDVRAVIVAELEGLFTEDLPLTDDRREAAATLFAKIVTALQ
jgi:hypothetical protein